MNEKEDKLTIGNFVPEELIKKLFKDKKGEEDGIKRMVVKER